MTIDERIQYLVQSIESLHSQMHEVFEEQRQQRQREAQHRRAVLKAMEAYLKALDNGEVSE